MPANSPLLRSRKDVVFLLSLLRNHRVFHEVLALQEKKRVLMGEIPLLLGKTEPSNAFLSVDFLIHRFFTGISELSADEYGELVLDFFDGANFGILEALSLVYLQNAASLSRVENRRVIFLERRTLVGKIGVFDPEMDDCSNGCVEKEKKMAYPIEVGETSRKVSFPTMPPMPSSPAPLPSLDAPASGIPEGARPIVLKRMRIQHLAFSMVAVILFSIVFWSLFGGPNHKSNTMVDRDRPGYHEVGSGEPTPAPSGEKGGIGAGSGKVNADLK